MTESPDVLLIRPWAQTAVPADSLVQDSLGVGYLAATLRKVGHSVVILDAFTFNMSENEIVLSILQICPRIVGLSLHSFRDYKQCVTITNRIKQEKPEIFCIWGGEFVAFLALEILKQNPSIDAVVMGEGEDTFNEISTMVLSGSPIKKVLGAVVRMPDGNIVSGGKRFAIDNIDHLPLPDKDIVETAIKANKRVAISMLTGRGCTNKCTFCTANMFMRLGGGPVWRRRKPKAVVNEIESLVKRYLGFKNVHPVIQFQDVIFLGTSHSAIEWISNFLDELENRDFRASYYFMTRADSIIANRKLLPMFVSLGLCSVEMGIESGVVRLLQMYNKNNSVSENEEALKILEDNGISYDASGFIMFDPRMTMDELRANGKYLSHIGHTTWDRYSTRLQVFSGTEVKRQLIESGLYNIEADLDNVYAYYFQDPQVAEVCAHIWIYDHEIYNLDRTIRTAKSIIAYGKRKNIYALKPLDNAVKFTQRIYNDHFLSLVDLAEDERLHSKFEQQMETFLTQTRIAYRRLTDLLFSEDLNLWEIYS